MLKKFASVTLLSIVSMGALYASDVDSCFVEVAVASPPVDLSSHVAFNVSNENGINRSLTLAAVSAAKTIENLPCLSSPYVITATEYASPSNQLLASGVGQCQLKAGAITLAETGNSVSVVYPFDFDCK